MFQRPEKSGVEMMEHMSSMRLFNFFLLISREILFYYELKQQNGHCFADNIFQQILTTQTIHLYNIIDYNMTVWILAGN